MMSKNIPEALEKALKDVDETVESATWDCHGTPVVLHKALEKIAAKKGIEFDAPVHLLTNPANKEVVIQVSGRLGDRQEWSIGEVSAKNCRNEYPFAMAEKRAKDRVILKLLGVAGDTYSEEEADEFTDSIEAQLIAYVHAIDEHFDFVSSIKSAVVNEEWDTLRCIIEETPNEVKQKFSRAYTKGGVFTTHEVKCMKQNPKGDK
jgi:hypothetical protein